jgi:hypothetical protein
MVDRCAAAVGLAIASHDPGFTLEEGARLFAGVFETVERIDVPGKLCLNGIEPALDYVASLSRVLRAAPDPDRLAVLLGALREVGQSTIATRGVLTFTATAGCLVCR